MNNIFNICVIDDDEIYQFTIAKTLESIESTNRITVFSDGEEAMNFISNNLNEENELPDVILLDINMPVMDGFQFMEEFVKIKPEVSKKITIYMVSSSVDPVDIERAHSISSISDYMIKPIKPAELKAIIKNLEDHASL